MKNLFLLVVMTSISTFFTPSKDLGYGVGDTMADFEGKNVDGTIIHTASYAKAKGFVIVFTCNTCPYAQKYEARINELAKKLDDQTWPLIAINSNDKDMSPGDSYEKMQSRAKSNGYTFPYIYDESQSILRAFGASKTPHFYVLDANKKIKYIGALDDNAEDAKLVSKHYVADAVQAIEKNQDPNPSFTKAIGCGIKKRPS